MLNHAFKQVENVIFVIGADNIRSQKAAGKIGGVLIDPDFVRDGQKNVVYKISRGPQKG